MFKLKNDYYLNSIPLELLRTKLQSLNYSEKEINKYIYLYVYIIDKLYSIKFRKDANLEMDYLVLNYRIISIILMRRLAGRIMRDLHELNIVEDDNKVIPGVKSRGYKLTAEILKEEFTEIKLEDKLLKKRLDKHNDDSFKNLSAEEKVVVNTLTKNANQKAIKLKYNDAVKYICTDPNRTDYEKNISLKICRQIKNGDYNIKISNSTKRNYNVFTYSKKDIRKFIEIDGQKTVEIDISNCQPDLLCYIAEQRNMINLKFKELCESGELYRFITKEYFLPGKEFAYKQKRFRNLSEEELTKRVKGMVVSYINAPRAYPNNKMDKIFDKEFNEIKRLLIQLKLEIGNSDMSCMIQQIESEIMIKNVSYNLCINNITHITIHDAVICSPKNVDYVCDLIRNTFKEKLNLNVYLKVKNME